jgi:hypothetical protein
MLPLPLPNAHRHIRSADSVQILERVQHHGEGNFIRGGRPLRGFSLEYEKCSTHNVWPDGIVKYQISPTVLLLHTQDPDDTRQMCDLRVTVKPFIYLSQNGKITTFPDQKELERK